MGRRGLGNCSLQQGACCICLEPLQVGKCKQRHPSLPEGDVSKLQKSVICGGGLKAGEKPWPPGLGEVSGIASGGQRPAEAGKVDGAQLGDARLSSVRTGRGARRDSAVFGTESGPRRREPSRFGGGRRQSERLGEGEGWGESLQINFAFTKAIPYLLFPRTCPIN